MSRVPYTARALQALSLCSDALSRAGREAALLQSICDILVDSSGYRLAWVGWALDDEARTVKPVAHAGFDDGYLDSVAITWAEDSPRGQGPTGTAIRSGEPVVARDILTTERYKPWRQHALARGYASSCALPIITEETVLGALNVYAAEPDAFDHDEIMLLQRFAANLATGVVGLRARAEAESRKALLQAVWDASPEMLFVHGPDGRLLDVNRAAWEGHGTTREAFLNLSPEDVVGPPHTADEAITLVQEVLESGRPLDFEWTSVRQDDRRAFPSEVRLRRIYARDEPRVLAMVRDLTEKKRAEQERRNIDRLSAVSLLAGGIAHDFNNLLAGILGNIQLAAMLADSGPVQHALQEAERAAERAAGLTRQLSIFARGEVLGTEAVTLQDLVEQTVRFSLRGTPVRMTLDLPAGLWPVLATREQVGQVVQNLAINAVQAMGSKGGTLTVAAENLHFDTETPARLPPGDYVALTFSDEGPGIPPELCERVLDPWFTTRPEGTGLGLAIAFSVARQHGGHLSILPSTVGARLQVLLPRGPEPTATPTGRPGQDARSMRILVMDDEDMVRSVLQRVLTNLGHEVDCHPAGASAVAAFAEAKGSERPFEFVILDMVVPGGMGGAEALIQLRQLDSDVPVIACTGHANQTMEGFDAVLRKPFRIAALRKMLSDLCGPT